MNDFDKLAGELAAEMERVKDAWGPYIVYPGKTASARIGYAIVVGFTSGLKAGGFSVTRYFRALRQRAETAEAKAIDLDAQLAAAERDVLLWTVRGARAEARVKELEAFLSAYRDVDFPGANDAPAPTAKTPSPP